MAILRNKEYPFTKDLSETEKALGVDLKLTKDGDLELNNFQDINLIKGVQNAAQALILKFNIEPGGLVYHPEIGTDLQIGTKVTSAFDIRFQLLRSILADERFSDANVSVTIDGNTIIIDGNVTLANTGIPVPLKFTVPTR
jgi:hypothetical protein